jgi:hypothetical protein
MNYLYTLLFTAGVVASLLAITRRDRPVVSSEIGDKGALGWAPIIRGPYPIGKAEHALVLTCYICQTTQVFMDSRPDHWQIAMYWMQDASGWRHRGCTR